MLSKIVIQNYRGFRSFQLDLDPDMNILVGDNDAGKTTILEAIGLALTFRLRGRPLPYEVSPHLFHSEVAREYISALREGRKTSPPEILIDLHLQSYVKNPDISSLTGMNNILGLDEPGVRVRIGLHPDYLHEYNEFIRVPENVTTIPTEYFRAEWLGFNGNGITARGVPATATLIDATSLPLQSGVDQYLKGVISENLEPVERVELARAYRSLRENFSNDKAIIKINEKLRGAPREVSDRELTLNIDVSQKTNWEGNIVPHLDNIPVQYVGKGEQSTLKILLALNRVIDDSHILLIEEPENHLSFSNLGRLVKKISKKCGGKQVFISTHSSFVLNKLGLEKLILLTPSGGIRFNGLPTETQMYFKKLSGYDTLRLVLARKAILVEGPSDELIVQRAYFDHHGCLPIDDGIDVINVRGLAFKRFLDIASLVQQVKVEVVTDNDGKVPIEVKKSFASYAKFSNIRIHVGEDPAFNTLEPQLLKANDLDTLNRVLRKSFKDESELLKYMKENKTDCALAIFESAENISMPGYIIDAIK